MSFPCDDVPELPVEYCAFTAHDARRRARPRAAGVRRRPSHRRVAVQGDILPRARVCRPQKTSFDNPRKGERRLDSVFRDAAVRDGLTKKRYAGAYRSGRVRLCLEDY